MKITILTLFPEMFDDFLNTSIIKKARLKGLVEIECVDIRSFSQNKHKRVDDYPFGGGQGLVMTAQPIWDALDSVGEAYTVYMDPKGEQLNQAKVRELSRHDQLILLCGHYEGIDERVLKRVDERISIGDYILTGGELAAMVITDAITRLQEGVIKEASHQEESFESHRLEYPNYTRPEVFNGEAVPDVLLSGHHLNIETYRLKESLRETWLKRPDLFIKKAPDAQETRLLIEILEEELAKRR